jgi:hypothetical protein
MKNTMIPRRSFASQVATTGLGWGACVALAACAIDSAPEGLRRTPSGPGARVVFDTARRPLPEVPLPNDIATFPDPTSRTGLRVNVSLVAPTNMEQMARDGLNDLEGWGTYAPIWASFDKSPDADPRDPALDLAAIRTRMPRGDFDFADDPVYLVNLTTGVPVVLDMGSGSLQTVLREPGLYWANDPHAADSTLLFETREEGAGLTQADYRPELDTDFDGVLDHPNTFGTNGIDTYDNLLTWYERETDSLILRPLVPMEEKTEYAVVFTDRLTGSDHRPILSPFEYVHHPQQRAGAERLRSALNDSRHAAYFGDLAGTGLDHVAFTWTFTTQPTQEDLRLLRDGLYGKGPFGRWASEFPAKVVISNAAGKVAGGDAQPAGWQSDPKCAVPATKPYVFDLGDPSVLKQFTDILGQVGGSSARTNAALVESLSHISHVVIGDYESPYLIGDPQHEGADDRFHVNFATGQGAIGHDKVHFWMVVPKETAQHRQPFPIAIEGHGYGGEAENVIDFGGELARQGVASVTLDMPHHGMALPPGQEAIVRGALTGMCYGPLSDAVMAGRAQDLNGDGVKDSGWWWWTPHLFHVRDNVRQGILDSMQLSRILASFDGRARMDQDLNGDGAPELAGDFDANGIPDVGGPITALGGSLGGIVTQVLGGVDHQLQALVPVVGGGGLTDIALRSYGVANAVMEQALTPILVAVPASERPLDGTAKQTNCSGDDHSVRFVLNDGRDSPEVEVACLRPDELAAGMTVRLVNERTGEVRCAGTTDGGRFRVPIPASTGDALDVQIYTQPHAVVSYGTCELRPGAIAGRRIATFEQRAPHQTTVATDATCDADDGCAQFMDRFFPVGSPLVAPQEGLGLVRQTPLFRRFFSLGQAVLDPADPINFAPYVALKALVGPDGAPRPPRPVLNMPSVGDNYVAAHTEIAYGRAAGIVPFLPPDFATRYPEYREYCTPPSLFTELGGKTPNQVLVETYMTEGIGRLNRTPAGPACKANAIDAADCKDTLDPSVCKGALYDVDWVSEGKLPFDQQHPATPLRLARRADLAVTGGDALDKVWAPRVSAPAFSAKGWTAGPPIMAQLHMYSDPRGVHGWSGGPCSVWDPQQYALGLIARFIATTGQDLLYLTRPVGHQCLVDHSCEFMAPASSTLPK